MGGGRAGLLRDPEFLKFWGGQSVSLLGSQFTLLALPVAAAVTLRAGPAQMGVLAALQLAPGLLFGLAAGVWLDRVRRRPVLVVTQVASAVVLATVPLAAAAGVLTMLQLDAVAFLAGTAAVVFRVAQFSFLPALVGRDRLVEANARCETSTTAAALAGPGLAGAAVQLLTAPMAIAVDAASFVVGAATAAWLRTAEPPVERGPGGSAAREAIEGLAFVWRQPLVRAIAGTLLIANAGGGVMGAVFVLLFVGRLGVAPAQIGLVFATSAASSLVGSLVLRPVQRRVGVGPVMVAAALLVGAGNAATVAAAFAPRPLTLPLLLAGALVSGFALMLYNIPQQAIQQAVIPSWMLARTGAAVGVVVNAGSVLASLAGGLLGQAAGLRWTLVAGAALMALCALPTAASPLRALRDAAAVTAAPVRHSRTRPLRGGGRSTIMGERPDAGAARDPRRKEEP